MTALLDLAIEQVRALPPERQEEIAQALIDMTSNDAVYILTPEEEASLVESIAQAERGEFASDEQVKAVFAKYGS